VNATLQYIERLSRLKAGDLALLRTHAGKGLNESVEAFDLFTGLWWPLRQATQRAPRRKVAWLVAKLYAFRPLPQSPGETLAAQLRRCSPKDDPAKAQRQRQKFDEMLPLSLDEIEPSLQWVLDLISSNHLNLDWVRLTDDLSVWERESTRLNWAAQFLQAK